MTKLYLVLPCYNEHEILKRTAYQLKKKMESLMREGRIGDSSKIVFVNDGSQDSTWDIINALCRENPIFEGINLSRNFGHQNALMAGLMSVKENADAVITIDADLQQDINAINLFLDKYDAGNDVVYGVRNSRDTDGFVKKLTAVGFYKLMHIFGCDIVKNHADYRLMSRRAIQSLAEFGEVNLFMRGLIPLVGFKSDVIYFDVFDRAAGKSKYTMKKMCLFAVDGITSFSVKPIRFVTFLGLIVLLTSIALILYFAISYLRGATVSGWPSLIISIWALGGAQLMGIGIIGEYVGKTYFEAKKRPRFIIEQYICNEKNVCMEDDFVESKNF